MGKPPLDTETLPTVLGHAGAVDHATLPRQAGPAIAAGTEIDRFTVLEPIGSGGMGVVVAAHDTMLDRKVALKLLRADRYPTARATEGRARLLREARAMAKLADHPHIITVHEVGLHGDDIFIAMELVDGGTLRTWVDERPRHWREVVDAYLAAGDGLAAAHRAGLVHRDFKPDNVLRGRDGRIRVTDFGLVIGEALESSPELAARPPDDRTPTMSTETGVLLGTPAYMAPEQHRHATVDARADQYSFCVSLYEALYRERPFVANSVEELARRVLSGEPPEPPERGIPGWLHDLVLRGLSTDPAERFPDMDALLAELRRDRGAVWRRAAVALGVLALAGGGLWLLWPSAPACSGGPARVAAIWDDGARARLHSAFEASGRSYAAEAYGRVSRGVDGYGARWAALHREICEATHDGERSAALLDRQMACLDRRLAALGSLLGLLSGPELRLDRAVEAVAGLPELSSCRAAEGLEVAPLPEDPAARARLLSARALVDEVNALERVGRYREGLARAVAVDGDVRAAAYPALTAEHLHGRALLEDALDEPAAAERSLREAVQLAATAHDDSRAAELWAALVYLVGVKGQRPDEALALRPVTEAALARSGNDPILTAHYLVNVASVLSARGDTHEAEPLLARAVAMLEAADDPLADLAVALKGHGIALHRLGRYAEARKVLDRALAADEEGLGKEHPSVADVLEALGSTLRALGQARDAVPLLERGLAIRTAVYGPDSPPVASSHRALGDALGALGEVARAETHYRTAIALTEAQGNDAELVSVLNNFSNLLMRADRVADALPLLERALEVDRRLLPEDHPEIGVLLLGRAEVLFGLQRYREAEAGYREAEAQLARRLPPDHPFHAAPLAGLGQTLMAEDRPADAIEPLERSLAITLAAPIEGVDVRMVRFLLARALWDAKRDRARARTLALAARDGYSAPEDEKMRAEVQGWLDGR